MARVMENAIIAKRPEHAPSRFQYLTDTDAGTPAGELLRRYWQPVALESEVREDAPLPVRIMGQNLVIFRDDQGRVGAIDRKCLHRCADLALGRIEAGGLRCPYHGWLFDVDGRCLERPAEAVRANPDRLRARAYPLHRQAGAVWIYLGAGEAPPFPQYPALQGGEAHRYTCRWFGDSNWLQASEGNYDPIHTSYLHQIELVDEAMRARWGIFGASAFPNLTIEDARFGVRLFTTRALSEGRQSLRVTNFIMPNACAVGGFEGDLGPGGLTMLWDVPVDNGHHWRWEFIYHRSGLLDRDGLDAQYRAEKIPGTDVMRRSKDRLYDQDRAAMARGSYLGLGPCFSVHDVAITQSQGQVHDQSGEHLGQSDIAIVRVRRMLDEACQVVAGGGAPPSSQIDPADRYPDLVVVTETVDADADMGKVVEAIASDPIFYEPVTPGQVEA